MEEDPEYTSSKAKVGTVMTYRPPWVMSLKFQHSLLRDRRFASPFERNLRSPSKSGLSIYRSPKGSPGFASSIPSVPSVPSLNEFRPPSMLMRSNSSLNLREVTQPMTPLPVVQPVAGIGLMECQALLVNVLMCDSLMNFFADKNFDECIVCVCGGTVRSVDCGGFFAANPFMMQPDLAYRCQCGFSAVVNKR